MKQHVFSYCRAVIVLLLILSTAGSITETDIPNIINQAANTGPISQRLLNTEYRNDISNFLPSLDSETDQTRRLRTIDEASSLSAAGINPIRKFEIAQEKPLIGENVKVTVLSKGPQSLSPKRDSLFAAGNKYNGNYKSRMNNNSLLSEYSAKVRSKLSKMTRYFSNIHNNNELLPHKQTVGVKGNIRASPLIMLSRDQDLHTDISIRPKRSRVRRGAPPEELTKDFLAEVDDVLRPELGINAQQLGLINRQDDLNKKYSDDLLEILQDVYLLQHPEVSDILPAPQGYKSLDEKFVDDKQKMSFEDLSDEKSEANFDDVYLAPLIRADEYIGDSSAGFSGFSKRGNHLATKMLAFLKQNPSESLRIPLQGPSRSTRISEKHQGLTSKGRISDLSSQSGQVCPLESDGSKPMRCPSDPDKCLYDAMICDGTSDCLKGEDETFALCVLRHWSMRWMRKFIHKSR